MGFLNPWGLLALLAIPAVLGLHLFRRRFRERRIAGLFLFAPDALAAQAGRTRTRLLRSPSLWLELAAALCLALWLGGLQLGISESRPHWVFVLDDSASMGARGSRDSASERAQKRIREILEDARSEDSFTLILTGERPEIAAGPKVPRPLVEDALRAWRPRKPSHDHRPALDLGKELSGPESELVYFTDGPGVRPPPGYRTISVGESLANAAVLGGRRVRKGDGEKLFAELAVWGPAPIEAELRLGWAGEDGGIREEWARRSIRLQPGRTTHLSLNVPEGRGGIVVEIARDALEIDNRLVLLADPPKPVRAASLFSEEQDSRLRLRKLLTSLADLRVVENPSEADLVLSPTAGKLRPSAAEMVILAEGEERDDWIGPFLLERRHALLAGVTLEGVVWSSGRQGIPGLPLVLAGDRALASEEGGEGGYRIWLNLDSSRSNLTSSPDWPILLSNLVEKVRSWLPGPGALNLQLGRTMEFRFAGEPEEASRLRLEDPSGGSRKARAAASLVGRPVNRESTAYSVLPERSVGTPFIFRIPRNPISRGEANSIILRKWKSNRSRKRPRTAKVAWKGRFCRCSFFS